MAEKTDMLVLTCPGCGKHVSARPDQLGTAVECPLCRHAFEAPLPAPPPSTGDAGRLFHFQCLRCGSILEARSHQSSQSGKCPTCAAVFVVPEMDPRTGLARGDADPGEDGENPTPVHAYAAAGAMAPKLVRHEDDSLTIVCPRCGKESPVTADNCPTCGLPFTMEGVSATAITNTSNQAHTALLLGLSGLVFNLCIGIGAILGVIAIIVGISALNQRHARNSTAAIAGIVLGVLDCFIGILIWVNM